MRGALIRLTNVGLFTMACWLVSVVFNEILAERLQPHSFSARAGVVHDAQRAPQWDERKVIIDRNLFGAKVARESKPPPEPVVQEQVEETKLPLELMGTLWSSEPQLSTAAIRDTGNRIEQVLAVGETLEERDGVTVAAIERGRVILQNGSRREELILAEDRGKSAGRPLASAAGVRPPETPSTSSHGLRFPETPSTSSTRSRPSSSRRAARSSSPASRPTRDLSPSQAARPERHSRAKRQRSERLASRRSERTTEKPTTSRASEEEQDEARKLIESLIQSSASPEEITARMQELEERQRDD
jgi:type II secretory pathway component PulC